MDELRRKRLELEAEGARRAKRRQDTIDEVKADLTKANRDLAGMNTWQQLSGEEYYGGLAKRHGDQTRAALRKRVDYLTRILELIEPQT